MTMTQQITLTFFGALAGLLPVGLTVLIAWFEKRSIAARQNRALDLAQKQVTFLEVWLKMQQTVSSAEQFSAVKLATTDELNQIITQLKATLAAEVIAKQRVATSLRQRTFVQRLLLMYIPLNGIAWVFHILFYMLTGIVLMILLFSYIGATLGTEFDFISWLFGSLLINSPLLAVLLLLRWGALRIDYRELNQGVQQ